MQKIDLYAATNDAGVDRANLSYCSASDTKKKREMKTPNPSQNRLLASPDLATIWPDDWMEPYNSWIMVFGCSRMTFWPSQPRSWASRQVFKCNTITFRVVYLVYTNIYSANLFLGADWSSTDCWLFSLMRRIPVAIVSRSLMETDIQIIWLDNSKTSDRCLFCGDGGGLSSGLRSSGPSTASCVVSTGYISRTAVKPARVPRHSCIKLYRPETISSLSGQYALMLWPSF